MRRKVRARKTTGSGTFPVFHRGAAYPLRQRHRVDTEVGGDLLDRHSRLTVPSDTDNVVAELLRVGLGHDGILPGQPHRASQIRCHLSVQQTPFSQGTRGSRYQRVKTAGSSARIQRLPVQPGWVARIQQGAILAPAQALDVVAWACAEGSLQSSLYTTHVAEDFWADVAAGRRRPP